jgi:hypothetical protein
MLQPAEFWESMRLSRRSILFIALALLTLAVQQGALLHGLSHGLEHRFSELRDDDGAPATAVCEGCLAYAGVSAALLSAAHLPHLAYNPPLPPTALPVWAATTAPLAYRARAPPPSV